MDEKRSIKKLSFQSNLKHLIVLFRSIKVSTRQKSVYSWTIATVSVLSNFHHYHAMLPNLLSSTITNYTKNAWWIFLLVSKSLTEVEYRKKKNLFLAFYFNLDMHTQSYTGKQKKTRTNFNETKRWVKNENFCLATRIMFACEDWAYKKDSNLSWEVFRIECAES